MSDIVERLRAIMHPACREKAIEAAAEIEQQKASAEYWRGETVRAADALSELRAEIERLRADNELLQADRNRWREMWGELDARAALEPKP